MENRLKERLTGAAILVALIVLLVPEMFHGQRAAGGAAAGAAEGPPVRSYTMDLSNAGGAPISNPAAPAVHSTAPASPAASGAAANSNSTSSAAEPSAPSAAFNPAPPSPSPPPPPPPRTAPAASHASASDTQAAASAAAHTAAAKHPASAPAAKSPTPVDTGSGHWSVQLGLFANRDNAERLAHEAESKGFHVNVTAADAKGRYHVHAAGLHDRAAAQALLAKLKADGLPGAVVAP